MKPTTKPIKIVDGLTGQVHEVNIVDTPETRLMLGIQNACVSFGFDDAEISAMAMFTLFHIQGIFTVQVREFSPPGGIFRRGVDKLVACGWLELEGESVHMVGSHMRDLNTICGCAESVLLFGPHQQQQGAAN